MSAATVLSRCHRGLLVLLLVGLGAVESLADEVPIPGGRFDQKRAKPGKVFKVKGWEVQGEVVWVKREGGPRNFALSLAPGAKLKKTFTVAAFTPKPAPKGELNLDQWRALISIDLAKPGDAAGAAGLKMRLLGPNTAAKIELSQRVKTLDFSERAWRFLPAQKLAPGEWTLEINSVGKAPLLIDSVTALRVPVDPKAMRFAKPNGVNGPDKVDSGALGFQAITAHRHWPLPVVSVREEGPAAKAGMKPGDVVLAVNGKALPESSCKPGFEWFNEGHESVLGRSVEEALATSSHRVRITVLRGDRPTELVLRPDKRSSLPDGFPWDDTVTPKLYDDLIAFIKKTRRPRGHWANGGNDWIQTTFCGLALMGRRDQKDADTIREIAEWFLVKFPTWESFGNLGFWAAAYSGTFMCEYYFATGDERVRPWIASTLRYVEEGFHTSKWGMPALGHGPNGLPYGQKALMAPASHVIVFEALAARLGFQSTIWEKLWPYMKHSWSDPEKKGHGAMGYNGSYRDKGEFWSRSGLFALAAKLRDDKGFMRRAIVKIMRERHPWMRNSHAYGNPGDAWGLIGLFANDRKAFTEVMGEWRWAFGGAWEPGFGLRHSMAHMGSPYMGGEGLINPALATVLSARRKGLLMTGASMQDRGWLKVDAGKAPVSKVSVRRQADGRVSLHAQIPGRAIVYTLDGSEPHAKSAIYREPFDLIEGGKVRARTVGSGNELGPKAERRLSPSKKAWKIVSASGAATPEESKRRAQSLIDGEPGRLWRPDVGEGSKKLPQHIEIDFGSPQLFDRIRFLGKLRPVEVAVSWKSDAGESMPRTVLEVNADGQVILKSDGLVDARFLKLEILKMMKDKPMRLGELELGRPAIAFERSKNSLRLLSRPDYLDLRYEFGGAAPTVTSKLCDGGIVLRKGVSTALRWFTKDGRPVGPVEWIAP